MSRISPQAPVSVIRATSEKQSPAARPMLPQISRRWVVELRDSISAAATLRAMSSFTIDRYVSEFETLYDELLAKSPRSYGWLGASFWPHRYTTWARDAMTKRLGLS